MIAHKEHRELVENLFRDDNNISSSYYEESEEGPDKFHVVVKDEVNEAGYADWMTWHLFDNFKITKKKVIISAWVNLDIFLDNVFNRTK